MVDVPDFSGVLSSGTFRHANLVGLHTAVVGLRPDPAATGWLVIAQFPPAGSRARRDSVVQLTVRHPPAAKGP
ncbi:MAG: PASTA domain-containing protein [Actinomycetota bacterium]|nr:PASTA domain-containing protein [Acidimicrobiia bacterium]MDQ3147500.1 PASTA domain-containing protein [Actinomycetota bacterium]